MESIITKKCRNCGEFKSLDQFSKHANGKYGRATICKPCDHERGKAYYAQNREKTLKRQHEFRIRNYEKSLERQANWRDQNREKVREYVKRWARNHKEKMLEIGRKWVEENRERARANQRRWANENKDKRMLTVEKRRAQKAATGGLITKREWQEIKDKYGNKCLCCGRTDVTLTMDHVIPLSKGGTHTKDNIQPICGVCNSRKHTKIIDFRPF